MITEATSPSQGIIEKIEKVLGVSPIWISLSELGATTREMHRRDIRRALIAFLTKQLKDRKFTNLEDLTLAFSELMSLAGIESLPGTSFANVSIAHCPEMGGFAIVQTPKTIGFEIDSVHRTRPVLIERISEPDEVFQAPDTASLWVAKQAAVKCLIDEDDVNAISQINISDWQQVGDNLLSFQFKYNNSDMLEVNGKGVVYTFNRFKIGICTF